MYKSINFGMINVGGLSFEESVALAKKYDFKGLELSPQMVMEYGAEKAKEVLDNAGITPACFGLPLHPIDCTKQEFDEAVQTLPQVGKAMKTIGCLGTMIWIISSSDMEYDQAYEFHVKRLGTVGKILNEYGINFGLEFIGPKVLRKLRKFEFIHSAEKMLELAKDCGPNFGLVFDLWHWYSGANNRDVLANIGDPKYIVNVHVNDAPAGNRDDLPDSPRALPGETDVIDSTFILRGLKDMGYQGPVVTEPFSTVLAGMDDNEEKITLVKKQFDKIWNAAF